MGAIALHDLVSFPGCAICCCLDRRQVEVATQDFQMIGSMQVGRLVQFVRQSLTLCPNWFS
jgi:hypothetical protein